MSLSQDLNSYLSKSSSSSSLSSLTSKLSSMKLPTLKTPFGSNEEDEEPFLGVSSDPGISNNRKEQQSWIAKKLEENLPSLSKKQRIIGFMTSLVLGKTKVLKYSVKVISTIEGTICFGLAISFLPLLMLNPRKFSLLFTLGSVFTLSR